MIIKTLISNRFETIIFDNKLLIITSKKHINKTLISILRKQFIELTRKRSSKQ